MHVAADAEITPILVLNSAYVGISTLLTELTAVISGAAFCIRLIYLLAQRD